MSHPAPPIARRLACLAMLLGALAVLLPLALAPDASAERASVPVSPSTPNPPPSPSMAPSAAAPPSAQVTLVRSACDAVHLTARTDSGAALTYRVADEAGNVVASGSFTGAIDRVLSLSTGHDYTASVGEASGAAPIASSGAASLREACPVSVTADPPGFADRCGTQGDAVVVPTIIGVDYRVGGTLLVPGANSAVGTVTVEASARPGYVLSGPSQWTHTFAPDPCRPSGQAPAETPEAQAPAPGPAAPPAPSAHGSATAPSVAPATAPVSEPDFEDPASRSAAEPAMQASVGGPGPLEWGIMIAVALAGGITFWLKTRH